MAAAPGGKTTPLVRKSSWFFAVQQTDLRQLLTKLQFSGNQVFHYFVYVFPIEDGEFYRQLPLPETNIADIALRNRWLEDDLFLVEQLPGRFHISFTECMYANLPVGYLKSFSKANSKREKCRLKEIGASVLLDGLVDSTRLVPCENPRELLFG